MDYFSRGTLILLAQYLPNQIANTLETGIALTFSNFATLR